MSVDHRIGFFKFASVLAVFAVGSGVLGFEGASAEQIASASLDSLKQEYKRPDQIRFRTTTPTPRKKRR